MWDYKNVIRKTQPVVEATLSQLVDALRRTKWLIPACIISLSASLKGGSLLPFVTLQCLMVLVYHMIFSKIDLATASKKHLLANFQQILLSTNCHSIQTVKNKRKPLSLSALLIYKWQTAVTEMSLFCTPSFCNISACHLCHQKLLFLKAGLKHRIKIFIIELVPNDRTDQAATSSDDTLKKPAVLISEEKQNFHFYIQKSNCFCLKIHPILVHSFIFSRKEKLLF